MSAEPHSLILTGGLAGLRAQALGLAEAMGLPHEVRDLAPAAPWRWMPARFWPAAQRVVARSLPERLPGLLIGCGGMAGAVLAALRRPDRPVVQVQNPRMDLRRFDVVVANWHDEVAGPNVLLSRTALHRVTPDRLRAEAERWHDRLPPYGRPLVAVLLGGNNGRYTLDLATGRRLADDLAAMMRADRVGVVVTPSRRTDPAITALLTQALAPLGGWVWDFTGDNPYFGMLALADMILVTQDSVSMISEAAATAAPVMVIPLPGDSRRQRIFLKVMRAEGRIRPFAGRYDPWPVRPLNDTPEVACEARLRLGL